MTYIRELSLAHAPSEVVTSSLVRSSPRLRLAAAALSPHLTALDYLAEPPAATDLTVELAQARCAHPTDHGNTRHLAIPALSAATARNRATSPDQLAMFCWSPDWRVAWRAWQNPSSPPEEVIAAVTNFSADFGAHGATWLGHTVRPSTQSPSAVAFANSVAVMRAHPEAGVVLALCEVTPIARAAVAFLDFTLHPHLAEHLATTSLHATSEFALNPTVPTHLVAPEYRASRSILEAVLARTGEISEQALGSSLHEQASRLGAPTLEVALAKSDPFWWANKALHRSLNGGVALLASVVADVLENEPAVWTLLGGMNASTLELFACHSGVLAAGLSLSWPWSSVFVSKGLRRGRHPATAQQLGHTITLAAQILEERPDRWEMWWAMCEDLPEDNPWKAVRLAEAAVRLAP
jgi:hypothetical protein